jgi:23S rRNA (cytosine1962-C5)-methyltransferase
MAKVVTTGKGRRWLESGHPWLYSDDVAGAEAQPGELVPVFDPNDHPLGWGLFSTHSRITVRMVTRSPEQPTRAFWEDLVARAMTERERLGLMEPTGACRLIAGDSERLPGFVVDRYADVLVVQSGCQGSDRMRDFLVELILERMPTGVRAILDRSDAAVRRLEALEPNVEWLQGEIDEPLILEEADGLKYEVDVREGHKTGHYLDQRDNRAVASMYAAEGRVLDAFCYDGLFGIQAARQGAERVLSLDQSAAAGERLMRNAELNGVHDRVEFIKANAMQDLRERSKGDERFDLVIVDPPAFARNRKEIEGAARGYRELNLLAMALVEEGGHLVSCSCSYNVSREDFQGYLRSASRDANRPAYLLHVAGASHDHPVLLTLPESSYLKAAFLRIDA